MWLWCICSFFCVLSRLLIMMIDWMGVFLVLVYWQREKTSYENPLNRVSIVFRKLSISTFPAVLFLTWVTVITFPTNHHKHLCSPQFCLNFVSFSLHFWSLNASLNTQNALLHNLSDYTNITSYNILLKNESMRYKSIRQ